MDPDLVADHDTGRIALERIGFCVAGLEFESAGTGYDASGYVVMAAADFNGHDDGDGDDRTNAFAAPTTSALEGPMLPEVGTVVGMRRNIEER